MNTLSDMALFAGFGDYGLAASGPGVAEVQRRLKSQGVYMGPISGTYDQATQAAMKAFQLKLGMKNATGTADQPTLDALGVDAEGNPVKADSKAKLLGVGLPVLALAAAAAYFLLRKKRR